MTNKARWCGRCLTVHEGSCPNRKPFVHRQPRTDRLRKTPEFKEALKDGICVYCASTHNLVWDHIVPQGQGGKDIPSNMQILCRTCNEKKNAREAGVSRAFLRG